MADLFFVRFLLSTLISSILILVICLVKRVFRRHLSAKIQYNIWFLLLVLLVMPFIPGKFLNFGNLCSLALNTIKINKNPLVTTLLSGNEGGHFITDTDLLRDFTLSVNRFAPAYASRIFMGIWILGILVFAVVSIICNHTIQRIKQSVEPIDNKEVQEIFNKCTDSLKIRKSIIFGKSAFIQAPIATGFLKTYVILPSPIINQLTLNDINYILIHELNHYKNKDIGMNYVMCFLQILYWFNPLVYFAFEKMRLDREIACDTAVLKMLPEELYIDYGSSLIHFIDKLSHPPYFTIAADIGGSKKQMKKRIEKIANFTEESRALKMKSILIFALTGLLVFSQTSIISAIDYTGDTYIFKKNSVVYEDLRSYFNGFEGSFVLYDLQDDQYTIYNADKSVTRVSPDSTYKIYSALIGLELDVIQTENSTLYWNGANFPFEAWNQDQDLASAIKNSVNWYFQDIDKAVGLENTRAYLERIGYGNVDLSGESSAYWMESSLKISPVEQVQLLTDFYTNTIAFKKEHVDAVKNILKISENNGSILSGKTGSGTVNDKGVNGWFIGYAENDGQTYIFATNIQSEEGSAGSVAAQITLSILEDKNIY